MKEAMKRSIRDLMLFLILSSASQASATAFQLEPSSYISYAATAGSGDAWSGQAPLERLTLSFDLNKPLETDFEVILRPERFDSGNGPRDGTARGSVFEVGVYPEIRFVSQSVTGDDKAMKLGDKRNFKVLGKMTLHGVTKSLELPVNVWWDGKMLRVGTQFGIRLSSFNINRPKFLWLEVDDIVKLDIQIRAVAK
jgi:polyisoprenoid-binding protein YceI